MVTKSSTKVANIFYCNICDYNTCRKFNYDKHLLTAKHTQVTLGDEIVAESSTKYTCDFCHKEYYSRNGLWKHKKNCNNINLSNVKYLLDDVKTLTNTVIEVVQQNKELTKHICELSKEKSITNNNTINKNFNVNFFLNEQCKDALNITDFVNSLQLQIQDVEETGRLGFAQGISRIFINGLNDLDVHHRPLHCSDVKREIIYIKNDNQWIKDNDTNDKLIQAIKSVAHKNIRQISEWQKANPQYNDPESKQNDKYMKIVCESMSGGTIEECDKNYSKIIKNISKETVIDKEIN